MQCAEVLSSRSNIGIPNPEFFQFLITHNTPGLAKAEDLQTMCERYPLWNAYWEDRKAKVERIEVPMYVTASWTNFLHTRGTFRGWLEGGSQEKWLRVHNSHEWPGTYTLFTILMKIYITRKIQKT
jgi:predicted acyl esterase